jgi:DNA-binding protein HU-beta
MGWRFDLNAAPDGQNSSSVTATRLKVRLNQANRWQTARYRDVAGGCASGRRRRLRQKSPVKAKLRRCLFAPDGSFASNFGLASPRSIRKEEEYMATKLMSKSELIQKIADSQSDAVSRKDVRAVMDSLVEIGHKELKKTGAFLVPGFAKFVVIKKPATKARKGINPFTKEPTIFKAKPARKIIKARPVKATKDAVG